ncbi:unnamed protein product [Rhizoctonia solani]|uniref:Uncharacterized protein n=1 Tax=Rhizoctonia solani TaxID=456999 RepID=A0A8H3HP27_9AGAM|nr:unnamed protein product [Rhizoctonia solani]
MSLPPNGMNPAEPRWETCHSLQKIYTTLPRTKLSSSWNACNVTTPCPPRISSSWETNTRWTLL